MPRQRKRIGPYRVLKEIGSGGMGVVFCAVHEVLRRQVAIKELSCRDGNDREAMERFRREGMVLAQLKHESIVGIHDLFLSAQKLYMVLELVDGCSLADLIASGPVPWDVAAIIGMRVAAALEHAHHHHVIHRDIKPSNIMLARSGEVKLTDFGIAKDEMKDKLTRTGFTVGTPAYMAPEALTGERVEPHSDLYSLGVTLYECASGRHPFAQTDSKGALAAILQGRFVPLSHQRADLPRRFRKIVERCMSAGPRQRFKSAADVRLGLELLLAARGARANHRMRIVGFLRARNLVSEAEALSRMTAGELKETSAKNGRTRATGWAWAAAAAAAVAAGGLWLWQQPELLAKLLR